jgi:hypothetical protein
MMPESFAANLATRRQVPRAPTNPFLAAAQRDFAARFVWATTSSYAEANHPPRIAAEGSRVVSAKPGEVVKLRVTVSDPDGNDVTVRWWRWNEADTCDRAINLNPSNGSTAQFTLPSDVQPTETIHIIAEATDNGAPALTRYERFIVTAH